MRQGDGLVAELESPGFSPANWDYLSRVDRAQRCRDFAAKAIAVAESKSAGYREPYLRLAADWLELAREIEDAAATDLNSHPLPIA